MKLRVKINVSFLCFQKQVAVKMPNFFLISWKINLIFLVFESIMSYRDVQKECSIGTYVITFSMFELKCSD